MSDQRITTVPDGHVVAEGDLPKVAATRAQFAAIFAGLRTAEECAREIVSEAERKDEGLAGLERRLREATDANENLAAALDDMVDWAERYRGGDEKLHPEEFYIRRDYARKLLKDRAALAAVEGTAAKDPSAPTAIGSEQRDGGS